MNRQSPALPGRILDVFWIAFIAMAMVPILITMVMGFLGNLLGPAVSLEYLQRITAIAAMMAQELALAGLTIGVVVKEGFSVSELGLRSAGWLKEGILGFMAGLLLTAVNIFGERVSIAILSFVLGSDLTHELWVRENTNILVQFLDHTQPPWLIVSTVVLVVVIAPVVEEIFFRGYGYAIFRHRFGVERGILFSSFLFAFIHLYVVNFLPVFLIGLGLTMLYEKRGSLAAPIAAHAVVNGTVVLFVWLT